MLIIIIIIIINLLAQKHDTLLTAPPINSGIPGLK